MEVNEVWMSNVMRFDLLTIRKGNDKGMLWTQRFKIIIYSGNMSEPCA